MTKLIVTAQQLNVYDIPNLNGEIIEVVNKGQIVKNTGVSHYPNWTQIEVNDKTGWVESKYLKSESESERPTNPTNETRRTGSSQSSDFPWFAIAQQEIGITEVDKDGNNSRILEYLQSTTLPPSLNSKDETAWCAAFVNWCLEQAGCKGNNSAWADDWLTWGEETHHPVPGCIVVFHRTEDGGHVGFFVSKTDSKITLLGGNQRNSVCEKEYPISKVRSYRVPDNFN